GGAPWGAEAAHRLEGRQREDELGLVVRVAVVAPRCVQRHAGRVLRREPLLRALQVGVDLEGQRAVRGDELEQVGQVGTEAGDDVASQRALRVGGDEGGEVGGAVLGGRGTGGV